MINNSEIYPTPVGSVGMILHDSGEYNIKTGQIENGEIISTQEFKNLIVNMASIFMALRMAPPTSSVPEQLTCGLKYLALGVGLLKDPSKPYNASTNPPADSWILNGPDVEIPTVTTLKTEFWRKAFTSWQFIDPASVTNATSANPTNVLLISTTFNEDEANGPIMEMGLFGGDTANTSPNTGYMFNYKTFKVWNKPQGTKLTITWKLTF